MEVAGATSPNRIAQYDLDPGSAKTQAISFPAMRPPLLDDRNITGRKWNPIFLRLIFLPTIPGLWRAPGGIVPE